MVVEAGQPEAELGDEARDKINRLGGVERSPLAAAAGSTDRLVDVGLVGHEELPVVDMAIQVPR